MSVRDSDGNIQTGSRQVQSNSTSMATQMLINKNKLIEEIEPIDDEKQKEEVEKPLGSIRKFNQINEVMKESNVKQVEK